MVRPSRWPLLASLAFRIWAPQAGRQLRAHLVENDLESKAEVDALVVDYLASAEQLQAVPAAALPYEVALAQLAGR